VGAREGGRGVVVEESGEVLPVRDAGVAEGLPGSLGGVFLLLSRCVERPIRLAVGEVAELGDLHNPVWGLQGEVGPGVVLLE